MQPYTESSVKFKAEQVFSVLCPDGFWNIPKMEVPQYFLTLNHAYGEIAFPHIHLEFPSYQLDSHPISGYSVKSLPLFSYNHLFCYLWLGPPAAKTIRFSKEIDLLDSLAKSFDACRPSC